MEGAGNSVPCRGSGRRVDVPQRRKQNAERFYILLWLGGLFAGKIRDAVPARNLGHDPADCADGLGAGLALGLLVAIIRTIALPEKKKTGSNVGVTLRRGLLRLAQLLMNVYIQVFRGTPMIVQAVVIYYGAQYAGVYMDTTFAAIFIISINTGAYMAEIIRGGIVSVDKGQFEAAHAIGMTHWQTMTTVVLPQAIRNILPSVGNELIVNIKDSSVLNVISVSELFFQAKSAAGTYYRYFEVYFIIAVIYLILTLSVSAILRAVEKKMDGPDNYVIHGSQSDSRANIKVSVENEKEAVKRWNV